MLRAGDWFCFENGNPKWKQRNLAFGMVILRYVALNRFEHVFVVFAYERTKIHFR